VTSSSTTTISLEETLKSILPEGKLDGKLPPVHLWNPEHSADIGMEIRADGAWWHDGSRINRERLVKLFSRILRKDEDGQTWLVTPYEKVIVKSRMPHSWASGWTVWASRAGIRRSPFLTNLDDITLAGPDAPIRVETDPETGEPSPYVLVRGRLEAKLTRAAFYDLVEMAEPSPDDPDILGVWSQGTFFPIGSAA
jgi:hypothetical protein